MRGVIKTAWLALAVVAVVGCASAPTIPEYARPFDGQKAIVEVLPGGATLVALDATGESDWVYFDLDQAIQVEVTDPLADTTWDLAFQRFRVKANGGVSGHGGVAVAAVGTTNFAASPDSASAEWVLDEARGGDRVDLAFSAEGNWFRYRLRSHSLESREQVKLIRSSLGTIFKLQMMTYYDRFLISGHPTFRYAPL